MSNPFSHVPPSSRRSRRAPLSVIIGMMILSLIVASCGGSATEPIAAPTNTPVLAAPVDTPTKAPPTATPVPPTVTSVPPTATSVPPTATAEPAATNTSVPPTATATSEPTEEPEPTEQPEPTETPLPAPTADNNALIAQGRSVFEANGCAGCHGEPGAGGVISPDLAGIAARAGSRVAGLSAEAYIRQSIQDPNAFVVPDCPPGPCPSGVMPQTFGASLSPEQLTALVTYLMSLN